MWRFAVLLAGVADSLTFLLLPPGAEANPIAAAAPLPALLAKAVLMAVLALWPWRYGRSLRVIGAVAWLIGAWSNSLVLLSSP